MAFLQDINSIGKNLEYIVECCSKNREERLPICCYWNAKNPLGLKNAKGIKDIEPKEIYEYYNKKFGKKNEHKNWCLYCNELIKEKYYPGDSIKIKNIRPDVKELGNALHSECHDSLELIQKRLIGAKVKLKTMNEEEINVEKFRRHYHEFGSLKAAFVSIMNLKKSKQSTHSDILIFSVSSLIVIDIARRDLNGTFYILEFMFAVPILVFLIKYFRESVRLNEVKDALYICVGVDVDHEKKEWKR
jgi:hypothetical protein